MTGLRSLLAAAVVALAMPVAGAQAQATQAAMDRASPTQPAVAKQIVAQTISAQAAIPQSSTASRRARPAAIASRQGQPAATAGRQAEPGVHRMGRANAPLTLTEYVSYTCSHCARFEQQAGEQLKVFYVGSGQVALELRHLIRDPVDLTAALLANCGPSGKFFGNHAALMREQSDWVGRLVKTTPAQRARFQTGAYPARRRAIARDAGMYRLMAPRGYDDITLDKCLADETLAKALAAKSEAYGAAGIRSTPSFAINDAVLAATHDWESLRPQLDARLKLPARAD